MPLREPQFGAILFRASQLVGDQGVQAFEALGIDLDARWLSIVLALNARGAMTSTQLASHIGEIEQKIDYLNSRSDTQEGMLNELNHKMMAILNHIEAQQ